MTIYNYAQVKLTKPIRQWLAWQAQEDEVPRDEVIERALTRYHAECARDNENVPRIKT